MSGDLLNDKEVKQIKELAKQQDLFKGMTDVENVFPQASRVLADVLAGEVTTKLGLNSNGVLCVIINGEFVPTDSIELNSIQKTSDYISDYLPLPNFCVHYSDSKDNDREKEARAIYTCAIISGVLHNQNFVIDRFNSLISNFDFDKLEVVNKDLEIRSFQDLLNVYKNMNSLIIKVLVSACNFKISDIKKDSLENFSLLLSRLEVTGYENIADTRKMILKKLAQRLSEDDLTNSQRALAIEDKDKKLIDLYETNGLSGKLVKIRYLTSECIPFNVKDVIYNLAINFTKKLYSKQNSEKVEDNQVKAYNLKLKTVRQRLLRMYLSGFKAKEVEQVRKDPSYMVIAKR